jgi:hypothetical protein
MHNKGNNILDAHAFMKGEAIFEVFWMLTELNQDERYMFRHTCISLDI